MNLLDDLSWAEIALNLEEARRGITPRCVVDRERELTARCFPGLSRDEIKYLVAHSRQRTAPRVVVTQHQEGVNACPHHSKSPKKS